MNGPKPCPSLGQTYFTRTDSDNRINWNQIGLNRTFLTSSLTDTLWHAYKCAKFQLPSSISYWDKKGVPKFNVGATSPLPYSVRWNFYVCSKYFSRSNSAPNFSIVSLCIMQLCEYVFSIGFPLYVPKNEAFWGFEGEDVKILSSNPQKALPCVNTRLLVYRVSKSVQQPEL